MEDRLIMSKRELERKTLLEAFICGKLTLNEVAKRMEVSYRQAKRIWRRYKAEKDKGLQHKGRGKLPQNTYSKAFRTKILNLYQKKYFEFGPTFAAEKLQEDDKVTIHSETLRLWLKKEGLWHRKRKRQIYRERRERRPCFGDLVQIDGSIHQWFDGDENYYCLLNMVDDATGICLALLDKGETTKVLLTTLKKWIEKYGVPKAVYVDLKSVYVGSKRLKEKYDDDLLIQEGFSVFEQVCKKLNIDIIRAYSPQAKGRVERKHGVFQDRLVKDLKLYKINSIEAANEYLEKKFLNKINSKFARSPAEDTDSHRSPALYGELNQIICWTYRRQLRNDWTILFQYDYYQVEKVNINSLKPETMIFIKKYLDGSMKFWHEDMELSYAQLSRKPIPPSQLKKYYVPKEFDAVKRSKDSTKNRSKTPWGKFNANWLKTGTGA